MGQERRATEFRGGTVWLDVRSRGEMRSAGKCWAFKGAVNATHAFRSVRLDMRV